MAIILWVLCLGIGFFIGFSYVKRFNLQFDKKNKRVVMPGSYLTLILSLSILSILNNITFTLHNLEPT